MNSALVSFKAILDEKALRYDISNDENALKIRFNGEHGAKYVFNYRFGDDSTDVEIHVWSIATIPPEKLAKGYELCSELNNKWRWVTFYIDSDQEVTVSMDAVIEPRTAGDECMELLARTLHILDEVYPEIMKLLWGGSGVSAPQKR